MRKIKLAIVLVSAGVLFGVASAEARSTPKQPRLVNPKSQGAHSGKPMVIRTIGNGNTVQIPSGRRNPVPSRPETPGKSGDHKPGSDSGSSSEPLPPTTF